MNHALDAWHRLLKEVGAADAPTADWFEQRRRVAELPVASAADVDRIVERLAAHTPHDDPLLAAMAERLLTGWIASGDAGTLAEETGPRLAALYRQAPADGRARVALARLLARDGSAGALQQLAELLVDDPPTNEDGVALALAPLFQSQATPGRSLQALFPRLLDAIANPVAAAAVLDLANFAYRNGQISPHPAADRGTALATLLGQLVGQLERLAESPEKYAPSPQELHQLVARGVGLVVSLCTALAEVGDLTLAAKLHQAAALPHRGVRTAAAAALARLGDDDGIAMLAGLAAEPVARGRALAHLEALSTPENDLLQRVAEQHRTPAARAEGELASWLAQPTQYGMPPTHLELVDQRRQYWPGYKAPVDCFLLRYEYRLGETTLAGVGIVGPMTFSLRADLQDLPPADIYAVYAGWQAEHAEILETPPDRLTGAQRDAWERVAEALGEQGFERLELQQQGQFFGEQHYVATANRHRQSGVVVVAGGQLNWHPLPAQQRRPIGPEEIYALHKGRLLLRAFNG